MENNDVGLDLFWPILFSLKKLKIESVKNGQQVASLITIANIFKIVYFKIGGQNSKWSQKTFYKNS